MIPIAFIVAFLSDAGAYFFGHFFGQHKLAPVISTNKTIEGAVGGMLAAVLGMLVYGLIIQLAFPIFRVNYFYAIIYGFLISVVELFCYLFFSFVKLHTSLK